MTKQEQWKIKPQIFHCFKKERERKEKANPASLS